MQADEGTLRGLAHTLKVCLTRNTDRAKGIVSLTQDRYLMIHDCEFPDEQNSQRADDAAEFAFLDDVARAREALTWRALVVAHRVGRAMSDYAFANGGEFEPDPWTDWRRSTGDEPAIRFVRSLPDDEFFCLRVAYHVNAALNFGHQSARIPTDGDINEIAPYVEIEDAPAWPQWFEILGEPLKGIRYKFFLQLAVASARRDVGGDISAKTSTENWGALLGTR